MDVGHSRTRSDDRSSPTAGGSTGLCSQCNKMFSSTGNLNKHLKNVHKITVVPEGDIKCLECDCSFSCKEISSLRHHLTQQHGINMEIEKIKFHSQEAFEKWKEEFEYAQDSSYYKGTGTKEGSGIKTTYYYCNRTGKCYSKDQRTRRLKSQGSCKIDGHCTSTFKLIEKVGCNEYELEVCKTHYGHQIQLGHIRIPKCDKMVIACKRQMGIDKERIVEDIQKSVEVTSKRVHITTAKDVDNIDRMFGINAEWRKHDNDAASVTLLVEEMKSHEDNPVLHYKPLENDSEDFMLVLQSPFQANMLKNCSSQKAVFVDDTHGTNAYGFHLTTLLVVDEYGEGFPVAWCISSHIDTESITKFFGAVKENVGILNPAWFMSDDADQFYNAWINTFHDSPQRILCTWHVLRAWRNNLKTIGDKEKEEDVYHQLKVLMDETDRDKLNIMIENAIQQWSTDESIKTFAEYFVKHYKSRSTQWASCYRISSGVNTNMYLEAFHHVLKYKFLKGKKNKRLDRLIQTLLKYLRHISFQRIIKLEKGKITGRIALIQKRHDSSKKLSLELVTEVDSSTWKVKSETNTDEYMVQEITRTCPESCQIKCHECSICVHLLSCTCPDSLLKHTICKHVHLVIRYRNNIPLSSRSSSTVLPQIETSNMNDDLLNEVTSKCSSNFDSLKDKIFIHLQQIGNLVGLSTNISVLKSTENSLTTIRNNLAVSDKAESTEPLLVPISSANNKNIEKQRSFCKKKKRQMQKVRFGNPSMDERKNIKDKLLGKDNSTIDLQLSHFCTEPISKLNMPIDVTNIANPADIPDIVIDQQLCQYKDYFTDEAWSLINQIVCEKKKEWSCKSCSNCTTKLNMIFCNACSEWFHWNCVGIDNEPSGEEWICIYCQKYMTNIEESVDSTSVNTKGKPSEATVTSVEEVEDEVVINVNEKPSEVTSYSVKEVEEDAVATNVNEKPSEVIVTSVEEIEEVGNVINIKGKVTSVEGEGAEVTDAESEKLLDCNHVTVTSVEDVNKDGKSLKGKTSRKRKRLPAPSTKKLRSNSNVPDFSKSLCKSNDLFDN